MAPAALQMSKKKLALVTSVMYFLEWVYEFRDTLSNLFFSDEVSFQLSG
jgi:hypothetical protein